MLVCWNVQKLRKHVRREHPSARPLEVDPSLAEKWKKLEHERELNDVFSTIRSAMPGAIVMGDYVIDGNFGGLHRNFGLDNHLDETLLGQTLLVICGIIMSTQTIFSMIAIIHLIRMIFLSIILALRLHLMFSTESLDFTVGSYWDDQGGGNDIEQVVESGDL